MSLIFLVGCSAQPASAPSPTRAITLGRLPTQAAAIAQASPSPQPGILSTPTSPSPASSPGQDPPQSTRGAPTLQPTFFPTVEASQPSTNTLFPPPLDTAPADLPALPSQLPLAAAHIVSPGPGAKLVSPLNLVASAIPGDDRAVSIQLIGEDGRELAADTQHFSTPQGQRVGLVSSLEFKLPGVAEAARLQVSTHDSAGRAIGLASIDLILLSDGTDETSPESDPHERFILFNPNPGGSASGGKITLAGYALPLNRQPVIVELQDASSKMLASGSLILSTPSGDYQPFVAILNYHVDAPARARLTLRQPDARLPGDAILTSLLVTLNP